jgi:integrase/recombinase XerD
MIEFTKYQEQKGYARNTIRSNENTVTNFKTWCESEKIEFEKVGYNELLAFVQYCQIQGNKINTIRMKIKSLSHYFEFLERAENPAMLIKLQGQTRQIPHNLLDEEELKAIYELQHTKGLAGKRTKVLLSLVIFQAVAPIELERIELKDVDLLEAKIYIPATRTTNSRTLDLKPFQLLLFQDYMLNIRKDILKKFNRESEKLLVSMGVSQNEKLTNVIAQTIKKIKQQYPKLKGTEQLRQSVISIWVQQHGLRKAQYMAGHKYVSSTERYNVDKFAELKTELDKYFTI